MSENVTDCFLCHRYTFSWLILLDVMLDRWKKLFWILISPKNLGGLPSQTFHEHSSQLFQLILFNVWNAISLNAGEVENGSKHGSRSVHNLINCSFSEAYPPKNFHNVLSNGVLCLKRHIYRSPMHVGKVEKLILNPGPDPDPCNNWLDSSRPMPRPPTKFRENQCASFLSNLLDVQKILFLHVCKMSKLIMYPRSDLDPSQNLIHLSLAHTSPIHKISLKSIQNFKRNLIHRETDQQ